MPLKILALAIVASIPLISGCASNASSNTTYARMGNPSSGSGAVSIPLN